MVDADNPPKVASWSYWLGLVARLLVGGVLLVAGIIKLLNIPGMQLALNAYQLFPFSVVQVLSYVIPITEFLFGLLLIFGLFTRISAVIASLLFIAFIIGIVQAWARGLSLDCGCFGGGGEIDPGKTQYISEIIRDLGLLALSIWLILRPKTFVSLDQWIFNVPISEEPQ